MFRKQSVTPPVSPTAFARSSVSWQGTGSQLRAGTGRPLETVSPQHQPTKPKVKAQTGHKNSMFFPAACRESWAWRKLRALWCPGATHVPSLPFSFPPDPVHCPVGMILNFALSYVSTQIYYLDRSAFASQYSWAHVPVSGVPYSIKNDPIGA